MVPGGLCGGRVGVSDRDGLAEVGDLDVGSVPAQGVGTQVAVHDLRHLEVEQGGDEAVQDRAE